MTSNTAEVDQKVSWELLLDNVQEEPVPDMKVLDGYTSAKENTSIREKLIRRLLDSVSMEQLLNLRRPITVAYVDGSPPVGWRPIDEGPPIMADVKREIFSPEEITAHFVLHEAQRRAEAEALIGMGINPARFSGLCTPFRDALTICEDIHGQTE